MNARQFRQAYLKNSEPLEYYEFKRLYMRKAIGNLKRLWFCAVVLLMAELYLMYLGVPTVTVRLLSMGTLAFAGCALYIWFERGWFASLESGRSWMDHSLKYAGFIWMAGVSVIVISQLGAERLSLLADSRTVEPMLLFVQRVWAFFINMLSTVGKCILLYFSVQHLQRRSFLDYLYDPGSKIK